MAPGENPGVGTGTGGEDGERETVAAENGDAAMDVDAIEAERATFSAKKDESPSVADAERVSNGEVSEEGERRSRGWRFDGGGARG